MKKDEDNVFYHASNESFSKSEVDFEINETKNENTRAKRLIWWDDREFKLETKPRRTREEKQWASRRRWKHKTLKKQDQFSQDAVLIKTEQVEESKPIPEIEDTTAYLRLVNAKDCIKDLVTCLYSLQLQH